MEYERINNEIEHKQKWAMQKLRNLKDEIAGILKQYKITGEIHYPVIRQRAGNINIHWYYS